MDKEKIDEALSTLSRGYESIGKSLFEGNFSEEVFLAGEKSSKTFASVEEEHRLYLGLIRGIALMGIGLYIQTRYFPAIQKLNLALSSITHLESLVIPFLVDKESYRKDAMKVRVFILEYLIDALKELGTLDDIPRLSSELFSIKEKEGNLEEEIGRLVLQMAGLEFKNRNYSLVIEHCNRANFHMESYNSLLRERILFLTNLLRKPYEPRNYFPITRLLERFDLFNNLVEIELQFIIDIVMCIEGLWDVKGDPDPHNFKLILQTETILKELEKKAEKTPNKIKLITILVKHARWHFSMKDIFDTKEIEHLAVKIYSLIEEHVHVPGFIEVFKNILEEVVYLALDIAENCANAEFLGKIALILDDVLPLAPVGLNGKILYMKGKVHAAKYEALKKVNCLDMAKEYLIETHGESHPLVALVTAEKTEANQLVQDLLV